MLAAPEGVNVVADAFAARSSARSLWLLNETPVPPLLHDELLDVIVPPDVNDTAVTRTGNGSDSRP